MALALLLSGCNREPSVAAAAGPGLPKLDLCAQLDQKTVAAVLGTPKPTDCRVFGDRQAGYTVRFLAGTAALTIFYADRIDLKGGEDRWEDASAQGKRDALIGVGDQAAYSPTALPQLVARQRDHMVSIAVEGAPTDQALVDHLVALTTAVLTQLKS